KYLGLRPLAKGNDKMAFLTDDSDQMNLSLFHSPEVNYPDTFHIGFIQENPARVDEINLRLRQDGYEVDPPPKCMVHGPFIWCAPAASRSRSSLNVSRASPPAGSGGVSPPGLISSRVSRL